MQEYERWRLPCGKSRRIAFGDPEPRERGARMAIERTERRSRPIHDRYRRELRNIAPTPP